MTTIAMAVDLDSCCGCFACQNACKVVNNLPDGVQWLKVRPEYCKPEEFEGNLYMDRFPVPLTLKACAVCPDRVGDEQPLCAKVCMGDALVVGEPSEVFEWALNRRAVTYTL